jgi:hypothetical protein
MTHTRDIQPALDHLEDALQASCASLITLQTISAPGRGFIQDPRVAQEQIAEAIKSLRQAITDLRALHDEKTSMLAFGFVLSAGPEVAVAEKRTGQFRPRRTA